MLDQDTKRRIDSARQILVGKVPDPKAQVEQITTALIYKFMDDMDRENEELGGKAKFLIGDLKEFVWGRLISRELSGQERLDLYVRALNSFSKAKQIPELFRTIFKDSFLPYRNPETLNLFLKEINGFTYDNSEMLGNAFEYLLSILGSQGDAGQFRTPRHIIDFIVEVVDPKKNDKILDPACGTAGFLISAYKHIKHHNSSNFKQKEYIPSFAQKKVKDVSLIEIQSNGKYKGDKLTPDNRKKLGKNIIGYDISPDMVRLSLVNMYLHGFNTPQIFEYDSLTYEDRWGDDFDIFLANPPFMTPKGGIRPHKRFRVQANRAEVLFVDYIAEHLTLKGRAGIIVPEGIIFKVDKAHKNLRKMLLEDSGLWAVVSLPAGIFKPYSGVKTSILFLDRERAKQNKEILFIKVNNDGFKLGDQRTAIDKNDLPDAYTILQDWQKSVKTKNQLAHWVAKKIIAESADYNLNYERYRETKSYANTNWDMVPLVDVLDYEQPTKYIVNSVEYNNKYKTPVLTAGKTFILGYTNEKEGILKDNLPVIIFDDFTTATKFVNFPFKVKSSAMKILHAKTKKADARFLFYIMQQIKFSRNEHKRYWISQYSKIKIPLPPLEVQRKIVTVLDGYQQVIDGVRQVVKSWKPTINTNSDCEIMELGDVCNIITGKLNANAADSDGKYPFFTCSKDVYRINKYAFDCEAILLSGNNASGDYDVKYYNGKFNAYQRTYVITINDTYCSKLKYTIVRYAIQQQLNYLKSKSIGGLTKYLTLPVVKSIKIPVPSIKAQEQIIEGIKIEQEAVESAKNLIVIHEQKIINKIAEIWGE